MHLLNCLISWSQIDTEALNPFGSMHGYLWHRSSGSEIERQVNPLASPFGWLLGSSLSLVPLMSASYMLHAGYWTTHWRRIGFLISCQLSLTVLTHLTRMKPWMIPKIRAFGMQVNRKLVHLSPCEHGMRSRKSEMGCSEIGKACSTCLSFRFFAAFCCWENQGGCGKI